ncbi:MAG: GGDEF domain-containing response regulator [Chloroflexota bacterium]|nr:diguanylate cyclase [Chloroflexota bacterium]MBI5702238.1 diguanylate cyclase [Chloroflexota bacterium]
MATILVVDTNATDRNTYVALLGNFGHRILEASNGAEALEVARDQLPDLVITDIIMPNMDGFTLTRRLHAEPLLMKVPVVFHTANYDDTEIHRLARASGIQHILRKPSEPHEILRVVNDALKHPAAPARLPQTGQLQREHLQVLANKLYEKVTELETVNEHLRSLSLTDGLTGLNNRRGFMILATGLMKFARRVGYSLCLLYIDLDSLKHLNDTLGHAAGDALILRFSRILTDTFRESDVIGRLGGDEFVVLMADATESDVEAMRQRLQANVDAHNRQAGQALITFSLGVIRVPPESTITMEELLAQADKAMYEHKQRRRQKA